MKKKVRIKALPKAQYGFNNRPAPLVLDTNYVNTWQMNNPYPPFGVAPKSTKPFDAASIFGPGKVPSFPSSTFPSSLIDVSGMVSDAGPFTPSITEGMIGLGGPELIDVSGMPNGSLVSQPDELTRGMTGLGGPELIDVSGMPSGSMVTSGDDLTKGMTPLGDIKQAGNKAPVRPQSTVSPLAGYVGPAMLAYTDVFANIGKGQKQGQARLDFRDQTLADNLYMSTPEGYSGNRGDYTLNYGIGLNFRPDEAVYGQFGKIAKYGGQMKRKIRITGLPQAAYGGTQNKVAVDEMYPTTDLNRMKNSASLFGGEDESVRQYMPTVPREIATVEAEKGETIVTPGQDGIPNMYKIGGKRHSQGGTPIQAGEGDFIFSDTKDMKIKDPAILESFGMRLKKGGYTPAQISKKFNLNNSDLQKTLNDPKADVIAKTTAERMMDNNLSQLGKLALVQEARKGFPQGPPSISMAYIQKVGLDPSMFMPDVMTPQDATVAMGKAQLGQQVPAQSTLSASNIPDYEREYLQFRQRASTGQLPSQAEYEAANRKYQAAKYKAEVNPWWPGDWGTVMNYYMTGNAEPMGETYSRAYGEGPMTTAIRYGTEPAFYAMAAAPISRAAGSLGRALVPKSSGFLKPTLPEIGEELLIAGRQNMPSVSYLADVPGLSTAAGVTGALGLLLGNQNKQLSREEQIQLLNQLSREEAEQLAASPAAARLDSSALQQTTNPNMDVAQIKPVTITPQSRGEAKKAKAKQVYTPTEISDWEEYAKGGMVKYQEGGTPEKPILKVVKNPNTGKPTVLKLAPDGNYQVLFDTYIGGKKTPTGANESWQGGGPELKNYINKLIEKGIDLSTINTASDFQTAIYDQILQDNPESIEKMWSKLGLTIEGTKYPNLKSDLEKLGVKTSRGAGDVSNAYALDFTGLTPEAKKEALSLLKKAYVDDKIGVRTLSLDATPTPPPASTPPPSPEPEKPDEVGDYTQEEMDVTGASKTPTDFYAQDLLNYRQAMADRLGINKYMPYRAAIPQPRLMEPTYYDPSRELAATAEMSNIAAQNLSQFTGPQAFNTRFSDVQGKAAANVANTLGRYNNLNVGVANEFERYNSALINDFNIKNALSMQDYYDKTVVANQQYDNSKRIANNRMNQQFTNALTNRAMTQVLNQLYPEYYVHPLSGGMMFFNPSGRQLSPSSGSSNSLASIVKQLETDDPAFASMETKEKYNIAKSFLGKSDNSDDRASAFVSNYMKSRGMG